MTTITNNNGNTSDTQTEMELLVDKCSICFDHTLDFCLINCRDQFCRACFSRYAHEVVKNSWGLSSVEMKCPVCQDILRPSEWLTLVNAEVRSLYSKHNRTFKTVTRSCPICQSENPIITRFASTDQEERQNYFKNILDTLRHAVDSNENNDRIINCMQQMFDNHKFNTLSSGSESSDTDDEHLEDNRDDIFSNIYTTAHHAFFKTIENYELNDNQNTHETILKSQPLLASTSSGTKRVRLSSESSTVETEESTHSLSNLDMQTRIALLQQVSHDLISMVTSDSAWKGLQFMHLSKFSRYTCTQCQTKFCFYCSSQGWHEGMSCLEWMTCIVNSTQKASGNRNSGLPSPLSPVSPVDREAILTLKWKIANSKNCPRCHTLINREEGCNKVDCTMCGFRFCWVCKSQWSEKCGFYRCKVDPASPLTPPESPMSISRRESEAENGVPDVRRISIIHNS